MNNLTLSFDYFQTYIKFKRGQARNCTPSMPERIRLLNKIGFEWSVAAPKRNAEVDSASDDDSVSTAEAEYLITDEEDMTYLMSDPKREEWNSMLYRLLAFETCRGHCRVPYPFPEDPALGLWVRQVVRQKDSLSADQRVKLNAIGFQWKPWF